MESFLSQFGLAAVFLFGFLEACCVPIPSEITFGFAGVLAGEGHLNIVAVIIVGTVAELIGSFVAYTVGRVGERPLVSRFGRYLLITNADIDRAERFFAGRGVWAVPVGRALPVVRTFISIVAGFIKMPAPLFGVLSLIGTAVWVTVISLIGYGLSSTWQSIARHRAGRVRDRGRGGHRHRGAHPLPAPGGPPRAGRSAAGRPRAAPGAAPVSRAASATVPASAPVPAVV